MVLMEFSSTRSLRMAVAEAATALLSSNENKTIVEVYLLLPDIDQGVLQFSVRNDKGYQTDTIECHRKTTYYMHIQFYYLIDSNPLRGTMEIAEYCGDGEIVLQMLVCWED
jgi:hypothetical protein